MGASPLAGLLVADLSRHLPGPLAARLLCDLGARVVKIEEPTLGDPVRLAPPSAGGTGVLAGMLLAGVESLALDLKRAGARSVLAALLERADVLLESFRPGTLGRLGLDPRELARRFPRLVVCSLSGFGQEGPEAGRAGHDLTYQAMAGTLAPAGRAPAVPVADVAGAWSAATAILAALLERQRTGRGAWIDAALLDAAAHANLTAWAEESGGRRAVGEPLALSGALPCYGVYRTRDGALLAVAALERKFWRRFCAVARRPDLVPLQHSRRAAARRLVAAAVASRTRQEWSAALRDADVPAGPVLSAAEARAHPQARSRALLDAGEPPGSVRLAFPALFDGERPRAAGPVPALGEQTVPLLAELGFEAEAASRRRRRALGLGRRWSLRRALWRLASR
jgi:crotonobetainyl-CoA:carnitine CoA-transferase CaiB-like acyl-CoA transferase